MLIFCIDGVGFNLLQLLIRFILFPISLCGGRTPWIWSWRDPSWSSRILQTPSFIGRFESSRTWGAGCACDTPASLKTTRTSGCSTWTSGSAHSAGPWRTTLNWRHLQVKISQGIVFLSEIIQDYSWTFTIIPAHLLLNKDRSLIRVLMGQVSFTEADLKPLCTGTPQPQRGQAVME